KHGTGRRGGPLPHAPAPNLSPQTQLDGTLELAAVGNAIATGSEPDGAPCGGKGNAGDYSLAKRLLAESQSWLANADPSLDSALKRISGEWRVHQPLCPGRYKGRCLIKLRKRLLAKWCLAKRPLYTKPLLAEPDTRLTQTGKRAVHQAD